MKKLPVYGLLWSLLTGCGQKSCFTDGDNVHGRINFSERATPRTDKKIIIESSSDGFAVIDGTNYKVNPQEFLTVGYTVCAPVGKRFFVRAFQDENGNGIYDLGEPAGRNDGTDDGNSDYKVHTIQNNTSKDEWNVISGVDITLDSTEGF